jgi:hypothetical protein
MKSYLSFVSSTVLSGTLKLFTMCIKLPMSMGYKRFEIPRNVTKV